MAGRKGLSSEVRQRMLGLVGFEVGGAKLKVKTAMIVEIHSC